MSLKKGVRALSLLMVVVLFGAFFVPMVSAEEIRTFEGQCIASYSRNDGDSGAPVFTIATNHGRKIVGIHSGNSNIGATFSPVSGVIYDPGIAPLTR